MASDVKDDSATRDEAGSSPAPAGATAAPAPAPQPPPAEPSPAPEAPAAPVGEKPDDTRAARTAREPETRGESERWGQVQGPLGGTHADGGGKPGGAVGDQAGRAALNAIRFRDSSIGNVTGENQVNVGSTVHNNNKITNTYISVPRPPLLPTRFDPDKCRAAKRAYGAHLGDLNKALVRKRWLHLDLADHEVAFAILGALVGDKERILEVQIRAEHQVSTPAGLLAHLEVQAEDILFVKAGDGFTMPDDTAGTHALTDKLAEIRCRMAVSTGSAPLGQRATRGYRDLAAFYLANRFPDLGDVPDRMETLRQTVPEAIFKDIPGLVERLDGAPTLEAFVEGFATAAPAQADGPKDPVRPAEAQQSPASPSEIATAHDAPPDQAVRESVLSVLGFLGLHFGDLDVSRFNLLSDRLCARLDESHPLTAAPGAERPRFSLLRGSRVPTRVETLRSRRDALFGEARLAVLPEEGTGTEVVRFKHPSVAEATRERLEPQPNLRWQLTEACIAELVGAASFTVDDRLDGLVSRLLCVSLRGHPLTVLPYMTSFVLESADRVVSRLLSVTDHLRATGVREDVVARFRDAITSDELGRQAVAATVVFKGVEPDRRQADWLRRVVESALADDPSGKMLAGTYAVLIQGLRDSPERFPDVVDTLFGWVPGNNFDAAPGSFVARLLARYFEEVHFWSSRPETALSHPLVRILISADPEVAARNMARFIAMWRWMPPGFDKERTAWEDMKRQWSEFLRWLRNAPVPSDKEALQAEFNATDIALKLAELLVLAVAAGSNADPHPGFAAATAMGKALRLVFAGGKPQDLRDRRKVVDDIGKIVTLLALEQQGTWKDAPKVMRRLERATAKLRLA